MRDIDYQRTVDSLRAEAKMLTPSRGDSGHMFRRIEALTASLPTAQEIAAWQSVCDMLAAGLSTGHVTRLVDNDAAFRVCLSRFGKDTGVVISVIGNAYSWDVSEMGL